MISVLVSITALQQRLITLRGGRPHRRWMGGWWEGKEGGGVKGKRFKQLRSTAGWMSEWMICSKYGRKKRVCVEGKGWVWQKARIQKKHNPATLTHSAARDTIFTRPERLVNVSTWPIIWNKSHKWILITMQNKGGPCFSLDNTTVVDNCAVAVIWGGELSNVTNCYVLCLYVSWLVVTAYCYRGCHAWNSIKWRTE